MTFQFLKIVVSSSFKRKSIARSFYNYSLLKIPPLSGEILDLGSTTDRPSYFRFLKFSQDHKITSCDISDNADVRADLEKELPFGDEEFDYVLCFNLLEHVYNYQQLVLQIHRILKKDRTLIGFVPFLVRIHADPNDYFRYSSESLTRIFKRAGFGDVYIEPVGAGPLTAAYSQIASIIPWFLRFIPIACVLFGDFGIRKIKPFVNKSRFPLGYLFVCK